ncbi:MAG TPA: DUF669 domain-containing protein [Candidatus Krumholzibacteria bacterium]
MARLGEGGDCRNVSDEDMEATGGWVAMPEGWYRFMVESSDYKRTKAGDGMCLHLSLRCLERGKHQGEEKRDFLTLVHPNDDATRIARARLKQLAVATGHPKPDYVEDSNQLHNKPVMVKLGLEEASDPKYGDRNGNQNRVFGYLSIADYRAKHGNGGEEAPGAAAPPPPTGDEPPPHNDADIPF